MGKDFDPMDVLGGAKQTPSFALSDRELRAEEADAATTQRRTARGALICASCGSFVSGKTVTPGHFALEVFLWIFLILPGVFYSVWRHMARHRGCEMCGSRELVPTSTPRGRQLAEQFGR